MKSFWVVRAIYRGHYVQRFVKVPRPCYVIAGAVIVGVILAVML